AVAAPGTASTSGNVTVASSSDRVTDQPGVNRHSAITQRSSSTTYTSEYSPVESVSVPWSRSTCRNCSVHVPVARCGACPASGSSKIGRAPCSERGWEAPGGDGQKGERRGQVC